MKYFAGWFGYLSAKLILKELLNFGIKKDEKKNRHISVGSVPSFLAILRR